MPPIELLLPFFMSTLVFALMPGPAILYTAAQTLAHGRRGGFHAAMGIHLGGFVHVAAAAAGLSALLAHVPEVFFVLRIAGALYLIWIGLGFILKRSGNPNEVPGSVGKARRAFLDSIIVEVFNPKAALFYIAFLPQFVDPAASLPVWLQLVVLGWFVNIAFTGGDIITVFFTSAAVSRMKQSGYGQRIMQWLAGSVLIGLGIKLAVTDR